MRFHDPILDIGVHQLCIGDDPQPSNCPMLEWDESRQILHVFNGTNVAQLPLNNLKALAEELTKENCQVAMKVIGNFIALNRWPVSREWIQRLILLARELIRVHEFSPDDAGVGEKLADWLVPVALETWLVRYDQRLLSQYDESGRSERYRILKKAAHRLIKAHADRQTRTDLSLPRNLWWTMRCMYDEALEKRNQSRSALANFRHASEVYIKVLMDPNFREAKAMFFSEMESSLEIEMDRVIWPNRKNQRELNSILKYDKLLEEQCRSWLLQRYLLIRSLRLSIGVNRKTSYHRFLPPKALISPLLWLAGWIAMCWLFAMQMPWHQPNSMLFAKGLSVFQMAFLGTIALIIFQLISVAFVGSNSHLSRLILPRALFGSFLAWITVIPSVLIPIWSVNFKPLGGTVGFLFGQIMSSSGYLPIIYIILLLVPGFVFSSMLILLELRNNSERSRDLFLRTFSVAAIGLAGASYWGLSAASATVIYIELTYAHRISNAFFFAIAIVGGSLALPFGMVVQIIWQDKSITDPIVRKS